MATAAVAQARRQSGRARSDLRERLEARREEIEAAALTRVRAISDSAEISDPAYAEGLRAAVVAAIDYGSETADPPIPVALLAQARMAARVGIPLDTVLRRYFAGYSLLGYFILEEAGNAGMTDGAELKRLLGAHAGIFDRLLAAVGEEHGREAEALVLATGEGRRAERIERLLAGEQLDTTGIPYDFEGWHMGALVVDVDAGSGGSAEDSLRKLAARLDCRLLTLPREGRALWAWLGSRRRLDPADIHSALEPRGERHAAGNGRTGSVIALGEPAESLSGWRLTHRQAAAALPVARRGPDRVVRYADVGLLACALQDDLLVTSLYRLYLAPLEKSSRDGGQIARETLRAYFATRMNLSSAAAVLGVNRNTVTSRLRAIEDRIGHDRFSRAAELELTMRLEELRRLPTSPTDGQSTEFTAPD